MGLDGLFLIMAISSQLYAKHLLQYIVGTQDTMFQRTEALPLASPPASGLKRIILANANKIGINASFLSLIIL
jgi:hypothetical protein